jgi:hypothetical protein
MDAIQPAKNDKPQPAKKEEGKIGMAILLWLLGVPGGIILLYLLLAH